jgi:23S rRNA (uracil1939-C5)-methyltransferase
MKPGETHALRIEKPAAGGWMIARAGGQVILVAGAVPDERAVVSIDRVGKGVAYGHVTTIEEASPDRREPFVDLACGGCLYAHIAYPRQLDIKSQVITDAFTRIGRIVWTDPIAVAASPDEGYRMRSRLHARDRRIGFFREGTHDICDPRATRQLLPETSDVIDELARRLVAGNGARGELELSENIDASSRVVHFEGTESVDRRVWGEATAGLALTGVTLSDRLADGRTVVVTGDPHVTDVLRFNGHEVRVRRHVRSFFQGNRFLLRDLAAHVMAQIGAADEVIDLYAGAGLFAVSAAIVRGARVVAVEGDRFGAADLAANLAQADGLVEALHQSVELFVARPHRVPSVVIVDPPRTGMSKEALNGALQLNARKVVYVSCDVATLARDTRRFVESGYDIQSISAFDFFPNTPHVETVVVMRRSG